MLNYEHDTQYVNIINHIIDNDDFNKIKDIKHHGGNRLEHSLKVSYYSYKIAKKLKLDYEDVARAGLLHDFYLGQVNEQKKIKDKVLLFTNKHPNEALDNSSKYFELSDKEQDIIVSHMFPIDIKIPKYAESWIVSIVDKFVSTKEFSLKFYSSISWIFNFIFILLFKIGT